MIAAIDALGLLMVVGIGVLFYRRLIHSKRVRRICQQHNPSFA